MAHPCRPTPPIATQRGVLGIREGTRRERLVSYVILDGVLGGSTTCGPLVRLSIPGDTIICPIRVWSQIETKIVS